VSENHRLPSEELAAFVAGYPYESIPQSVLRENRRRILDTLGVAIGAREARPVEILLELTHELGGNPQAGVPGHDLKTSVTNAARLFGVMSHVLDFDDTHLPTILHPSGPTLAAALPLAEHPGDERAGPPRCVHLRRRGGMPDGARARLCPLRRGMARHRNRRNGSRIRSLRAPPRA
jgi:2-methylcitrate dehydratase PrpD